MSAGQISSATGAAIGTAIFPGVGTALGAAGGSLFAAFGGHDDPPKPPKPWYVKHSTLLIVGGVGVVGVFLIAAFVHNR